MKQLFQLLLIAIVIAGCDKFEKSREPLDKQEGKSLHAVKVNDLANYVKSVSSGFDHTCAILVDNSLRCFGGNARGQLGNGVKQGRQPTPVEVVQGENKIEWREVSAGNNYTCGISSDNYTFCWGTLRIAEKARPPVDFRFRSAGLTNASTATSDDNDDEEDPQPPGGPGTEPPVTPEMPPVLPGMPPVNPGMPPVNPENPGLPGNPGNPENPPVNPGNPPVAPRPVPKQPLPTNPPVTPRPEVRTGPMDFGMVPRWVEAIAPGFDRVFTTPKLACVTSSASPGDIKCLGSYSVEIPVDQGRPNFEVQVLETPGVPGGKTTWGGAASVVSFSQNTCALRDGEVDCMFFSPVGTESNNSIESLAAGELHACVTRNFSYTGEVWCAGDNRFKQTGDLEANVGLNPEGRKIQFQKVKGFDNKSSTKQLALGSFHSCALLNNGTVKCWGRNDLGQLGTGSTGDPQAAPQDVRVARGKLLTDVRQISAGANHTCAVKTDQTLWCWGNNMTGQVGIP